MTAREQRLMLCVHFLLFPLGVDFVNRFDCKHANTYSGHEKNPFFLSPVV